MADRRDDEFRGMSRRYGVLSLTKRRDSIPMWVHYAAAHTGFVVGFSTESTPFKEAVADGKLNEVRYESDRVHLTRGLPGRSHVGPDAILRTKSKEWEYEQEWRWIETRDPFDYAEVVAATNGELLVLRQLPPSSIREIILGCRISAALAESFEALRSTREYGHLNLFRVALNGSQYKLDIDPL